MKKINLSTVISTCTVCLLLHFPNFANISDVRDDPLLHLPKIVISDPDWPPYFFKGAAYQPPGFAKELISLCVPEAGYRPEFIHFPIKRMRYFMEEGKIDVHIFSYKKERESFLLYAKEPIFSASYRPFVHIDNPIVINQQDDFDGLVLGHLQGLRYSNEFYQYIEQRIEQNAIRVVGSNNALLKLLLDQKIDIFVNTSDTMFWLAQSMAERHNIKMLDYDIQTKNYFFSLAKKSKAIVNKQQFLDDIDRCLSNLKKKGDYQAIASRYGMAN